QGVYTNPDGDRFEGGWENDKKHGKGTLVFPTGQRKSGYWVKDKFHSRKPDESSFAGMDFPEE
ncbi:MAG TPA: hypothetical protein ENO11_06820, partial [Desulfobacteraceae bacterium]|nr:hypothetical protein [Desulfobacteraceae bacterium]